MQVPPSLALPGPESPFRQRGKGCWEAVASQNEGEGTLKVCQIKFIHKTNIFGTVARGWAAAGTQPRGPRSWLVRSCSPLEVGREWGGWGEPCRGQLGLRQQSQHRPRCLPPGLGPLAPVYLLASFFKISHKSLPWKHNAQHFSVGEKENKSISFPCTCLEFLNVSQSPEPWQACS